MTTEPKKKVLFWLSRRLASIEDAPPDALRSARAGSTYEQRRALEERHLKQVEENKAE